MFSNSIFSEIGWDALSIRTYSLVLFSSKISLRLPIDSAEEPKFEYDLSEFKGRMIRVEFRSHHDETFNTNFYLDNVSVTRTKVRTQRPSPR